MEKRGLEKGPFGIVENNSKRDKLILQQNRKSPVNCRVGFQPDFKCSD